MNLLSLGSLISPFGIGEIVFNFKVVSLMIQILLMSLVIEHVS